MNKCSTHHTHLEPHETQLQALRFLKTLRILRTFGKISTGSLIPPTCTRSATYGDAYVACKRTPWSLRWSSFSFGVEVLRTPYCSLDTLGSYDRPDHPGKSSLSGSMPPLELFPYNALILRLSTPSVVRKPEALCVCSLIFSSYHLQTRRYS